MARKARVEFPGVLYHVLDRGEPREAIFRDDRGRKQFLETLGWRRRSRMLLASPWEKLRPGLVLGGDALVERVAQLLRSKPLQEEVRWTVRQENAAYRIAVGQALAREQPERAWRVWIRVRLGGERRVDVARAVGYMDGSAITHQIQRLEAEVATQPAVAARTVGLHRSFAKALASFKS